MKYTRTAFLASILMGAFATSSTHAEWTFDQYGQSEIDILINSLGNELYEGVIRGRVEELRLLLQQKDAPINHQDYKGRTPLMKAAYFNMYEIMEVLIEMGADTALTDNKGRTALQYVGLRRSYGLDESGAIRNYYTKSRHNACIDLLTDNAVKRAWLKRWRENKKQWGGLFFYRIPS